MIETKTRKKILPARNLLRALRIDNLFRKPSSFEENLGPYAQISHEEFDAYERIVHEKALLDAQYTKAWTMTNLQRQRFVQ